VVPVDTWGCVGKESYEMKALADRVARRRKKSGKRVVVYHCQFCNGWHMGSPNNGRYGKSGAQGRQNRALRTV